MPSLTLHMPGVSGCVFQPLRSLPLNNCTQPSLSPLSCLTCLSPPVAADATSARLRTPLQPNSSLVMVYLLAGREKSRSLASIVIDRIGEMDMASLDPLST